MVVSGISSMDDLQTPGISWRVLPCGQTQGQHGIVAQTWWPCLTCVIGTSEEPGGSPVDVWKPYITQEEVS